MTNNTIKKQIIINADDFGLSKGINEGIIRCYRAGVVSRISFISNTDFFHRSVELLKSYGIKEIGVHLNLVDSQEPLNSRLEGILDSNGRFFSNYTVVIKNLIFKKVEMHGIEKEFRLQIERVFGEGFRISHLDSHQHLHLFPVISDIVLKLALEYKVPYVRCPYFEKRNLKSIIVNRFSATLRDKIGKLNLLTSDYFKGFDFSGHLDEKKLRDTLDSLKEGFTELVVHPGMTDKFTSNRYDRGYDRETEMKVLLFFGVQAKIGDSKVVGTLVS